MPLFPETRYSIVADLRSDNAEVRARATEAVARVYRAPIVAVLQLRWRLEMPDAEDLAHDFLAHALERDWLQRYERTKGRFRTFLCQCAMAYASTAHEGANRLKRGGGAAHLSLDPAVHAPASDADVEALFEREWVRSVFAGALEALRRECEAAGRHVTYEVFVAYDVDGAEAIDRPSYAALAERFGIPVTQVTNYLNWARRALRVHVLDTLRALTASEEEFREEARALLGVEVS